MARLIQYKASFRGMKALRSSRMVDQHLEKIGHRIAAVAQSAYDSDPPGGPRLVVEVLNDSGSDTNEPRARVAVIARHPAALRIEADRRVLGGALDAAR